MRAGRTFAPHVARDTRVCAVAALNFGEQRFRASSLGNLFTRGGASHMAEPKSEGGPQIVLPSSSGTYPRAERRRVLAHPDPRLSVPAHEIDPCDPEIVLLAEALVETMRSSPACIGIAATQVGVPAHVFCMDVTGHKNARSCAGLVVLANARIVAASSDVVMREGCMSVPHLTGRVARAAEVTVEGAVPKTGHVVRISANAIEARCLQHEIDHLDGFLFVDRVRDPGVDLFKRKRYA
jgi:peptide deformylase